MLQELQEQMTEMRGEIAALKGPASGTSSSVTTLQTPSDNVQDPPNYLPIERIPGTSWSEEMDIVQPLDDNTPDADVTCPEGARVAEVSQATADLLKRSFVSIKNKKRLATRNVYALPKVAVTKAPSLDQVMASQCSKSTKSNAWILSRIQALMLDAMAPLSEVMELFHSDAEEISSEDIAKAVEAAITLIGNASSQLSTLRRTHVLREYNKDLLEWAQKREAKFIENAPALFGQDFPKEVTDYLDQVAALRRAKAAAKHSSGFQKAYPQRPPNKPYRPHQRPAPYPQVRQPANHQQKKPRK